MAGAALIAGVVVAAADDGADRHGLVHDASQIGKQLADFDAGNGGWNRIELATDFGGRIDLEVVHVLMRRATAEVDHDQRLVALSLCPADVSVLCWLGGSLALPGACLGVFEGQKLREGQPAEAEGADADKVAAGDSVAVSAGRFRP